MTTIYISHDLINFQLVRNVIDGLESLGVKCVHDTCTFPERQSFHQMVAQIKQTNHFILFLTESYMDRVGDEIHRNDRCQLEYMYAIRQKTSSKIIPIVLEQNMLHPQNCIGLIGLLSKELLIDMTGNCDDASYIRSKVLEIHQKIEFSSGESTQTSMAATFKDLGNIFFNEEDGGISTALWRANHSKHMVNLSKLKCELFKKGYRKINTGLGKYEGKMIHDEREGYGIMKYNDDKIYEGLWENDVYEGIGKLIYKNKDVVEGQFSIGVPHGIGKYIWNNGDIYEGEFYYGMREGHGKKTYIEDGRIEVGQWKQNVYQKKQTDTKEWIF